MHAEPRGRAAAAPSSHRVRGTAHAHDRRPAGAHQARSDQPHRRGAADRAQDPTRGSSSSCGSTRPASACRSPSPTRTRHNGTITIIFQVVGKSTAHARLPGASATPSRTSCGPLGVRRALREDRHRRRHRRRLGHRGAASPAHRAPRRSATASSAIIGAREKDLLILEDEMRALCDELIVTTDDGSYGMHGMVTDALQALVERQEHIDQVLAVGPLVMMRAVTEMTRIYGLPTRGEPQPDHGRRHRHVRRLPLHGAAARPSSPASTAPTSTASRSTSTSSSSATRCTRATSASRCSPPSRRGRAAAMTGSSTSSPRSPSRAISRASALTATRRSTSTTTQSKRVWVGLRSSSVDDRSRELLLDPRLDGFERVCSASWHEAARWPTTSSARTARLAGRDADAPVRALRIAASSPSTSRCTRASPRSRSAQGRAAPGTACPKRTRAKILAGDAAAEEARAGRRAAHPQLQRGQLRLRRASWR